MACNLTTAYRIGGSVTTGGTTKHRVVSLIYEMACNGQVEACYATCDVTRESMIDQKGEMLLYVRAGHP